MTEAANWRDVKAKARAIDPTWDSAIAWPGVSRCANRCSPPSAAPNWPRSAKQLGLTQVQLAEATGLSQARISQIENGDAVGLDTLRAYVVGLGGHLDIVARIGNIQLNVA
jgi:hypothetical protein